MTEVDLIQTKYSYLTKDIFENILRKDNSDDKILIQEYSLVSALGVGENYGSDILRAAGTFENHGGKIDNFSFIIKTSQMANEQSAKIIEELGTFRKELYIYEQLLPRVYNLLQSIGDETTFTAKCYYSDSKNGYLVFDDLKPQKYKCVDKSMGLDMEHFTEAFRVLAKWHACTAVLCKQDSSIADNFESSILHTGVTKSLNVNIIETLGRIAKSNGQTKLAEKLIKLSSSVHELAISATKRNSNDMNIITHGDVWCNNMMFTYNDDGTLKVATKFLDFQCGYYGSPVLDIVNLILCSPHPTLREYDWNLLVLKYYEELTTLLNKFEYTGNIPTLVDIQVERIRRCIYIMPMAFLSLTLRNMIVQDPTAVLKFMDNSEENAQYREHAMTNPKIKEMMEIFLNYFNSNGVFDIVD